MVLVNAKKKNGPIVTAALISADARHFQNKFGRAK
jgi:hypothetical protein